MTEAETAPTNPFEILVLDASADAEQIQSAYKRLAQQFHPDRNADPDAGERFKRIQAAYETLKQPDKRQRWRQYLRLQPEVKLDRQREHEEQTRAPDVWDKAARSLLEHYRSLVDGNGVNADELVIADQQGATKHFHVHIKWTLGARAGLLGGATQAGDHTRGADVFTSEENLLRRRRQLVDTARHDGQLAQRFAKKLDKDEHTAWSLAYDHGTYAYFEFTPLAWMRHCGSCGGLGQWTCESCGGRGRLRCQFCAGRGWNPRRCSRCFDHGWITQRENRNGVMVGEKRVICDVCYGNTQPSCLQCLGRGWNNCNGCGGSGIRSCAHCRATGLLTDVHTVEAIATPDIVYRWNKAQGGELGERFIEKLTHNELSGQQLHALCHPRRLGRDPVKAGQPLTVRYGASAHLCRVRFRLPVPQSNEQTAFEVEALGSHPRELNCPTFLDAVFEPIARSLASVDDKRLAQSKILSLYEDACEYRFLRSLLDDVARNPTQSDLSRHVKTLEGLGRGYLGATTADTLARRLFRLMQRLSPRTHWLPWVCAGLAVSVVGFLLQAAKVRGALPAETRVLALLAIAAVPAVVITPIVSRLLVWRDNRRLARRHRRRSAEFSSFFFTALVVAGCMGAGVAYARLHHQHPHTLPTLAPAERPVIGWFQGAMLRIRGLDHTLMHGVQFVVNLTRYIPQPPGSHYHANSSSTSSTPSRPRSHHHPTASTNVQHHVRASNKKQCGHTANGTKVCRGPNGHWHTARGGQIVVKPK